MAPALSLWRLAFASLLLPTCSGLAAAKLAWRQVSSANDDSRDVAYRSHSIAGEAFAAHMLSDQNLHVDPKQSSALDAAVFEETEQAVHTAVAKALATAADVEEEPAADPVEPEIAQAFSHDFDANVLQPRPMRLLLVCLQSSGCTLFAKVLGQHAKTMAFLDTHIYVPAKRFPTPEQLEPRDAEFIVLKTTIVGIEVADPLDRLEEIKARFRPDKTLLFVRHPGDNLEHLRSHAGKLVDVACEPRMLADFGYATRCGSPENKLRALEVLWNFRQDIFDAVVSYSDLVEDEIRWDHIIVTVNSIGFPLERNHFAMERNTIDVESFARSRMGRANFEWQAGDVYDGPIDIRPDAGGHALEDEVRQLCPDLIQMAGSFHSSLVEAEAPLDDASRREFKRRAGESNQLILLFANTDYAETLLNWFAVAKSTGSLGSNYAVVCLDEMMEALLSSHGEWCFSARPRFNKRLDGTLHALGPLWMMRLRILEGLLGDGLDVVLTDNDALWLSDPMPAITKAVADTNADLVASRGRTPPSVRSQWGATACMGFIYFRSTSATKALLQHMFAFAKKSMIWDDQILLNTVLLSAGLTFDHILEFEKSGEVDVGVIPTGRLPADLGGSLSMGLLPHSKFMRMCDDNSLRDVTVAHCVSSSKGGSTGHAKRDELARRGLWMMPERWASISTPSEFEPWIRDVTVNHDA